MKGHPRIVGIVLTAKGFAFAVLDNEHTLANWGEKRAEGDKNKEVVAKVKRIIAHYKPGVVVLEDTSVKAARRDPRIRKLSKQIAALARRHKAKVEVLSTKQVQKVFFADGKGTKYDIAQVVARRCSEEMNLELPPKRKAGDSEHPRMSVFDAVGLVMAYRLRKAGRTLYQRLSLGE